MIKIKRLLVVLFLLPFYLSGYSQYKHQGNFGVKIGTLYSELTNLSQILVSEDYYSGYDFSSAPQFSPTATLFFSYHNIRAHIGVEPQLVYYRLSTNLDYHDQNQLAYKLKFNYHYVGLATYLKIYPVGGLNLRLGAKVGFNVSPSNLHYSSNQDQIQFAQYHYETAQETQSHLKNKIQGKNDLAVGAGISYEFPFGLSVDAMCHYSMADLIETLPNEFSWIDNKNLTHQLELRLGYAFRVSYK